jgi:predicted GIY-YIG superfamily endonuclease
VIYLLHFDRPLAHAQHYLGFTDDLETRLRLHANPNGSSHHRLMQVIHEQGIGFVLARAWDGDRTRERALKQHRNGRRLCPICNANAHRRAVRGCLDLEGKQLVLPATRAGVEVFGSTVYAKTIRRGHAFAVTARRSPREGRGSNA